MIKYNSSNADYRPEQMAVSGSISVLEECKEIQRLKSLDYQNPNSRIRQADHYPNGIMTIMDMAYQKLMRIYSLLESGCEPSHEPIEDSLKDAINFLSFGVSYLRGTMDGQKRNHDIFNKKVLKAEKCDYNEKYYNDEKN